MDSSVKNRFSSLKSGQASVEFMAILAFLAMLLCVIYAVSSNQLGDVSSESSVAAGEGICSQIAAETNTAVGMGSGYQRTFYLPLDVNGAAYTVTVSAPEQAVYVSWIGYSCRAPLLTAQVSGAPHAGANKVSNNNNAIAFS